MLYSSLCSFASFVTFTHCGKTAFLKIIQKCEQFVKNSSNCNYHKIDNVKTIQFDELFSNSNITWKILSNCNIHKLCYVKPRQFDELFSNSNFTTKFVQFWIVGGFFAMKMAWISSFNFNKFAKMYLSSKCGNAKNHALLPQYVMNNSLFASLSTHSMRRDSNQTCGLVG